MILAPVKTDLCAGPLVRFTVHDDGTATGSVLPSRVGFMELREQRTPDIDFRHRRWDDPHAELTHTDLMPWTTLGNEAPRWAVAVAIPGCRYELWKRTPGRNPDHGVAWLAESVDRIVGQCRARRARPLRRAPARPRRLWNEAEAACRCSGKTSVSRLHKTGSSPSPPTTKPSTQRFPALPAEQGRCEVPHRRGHGALRRVLAGYSASA